MPPSPSSPDIKSELQPTASQANISQASPFAQQCYILSATLPSHTIHTNTINSGGGSGSGSGLKTRTHSVITLLSIMCLRPIQLSPGGVPLPPLNNNFNNNFNANANYINCNINQSNSNKKAVELVVHHLHFYYYYYFSIILITFTTALRYHGNIYYHRYEKTNNNGTIMEH